MGTLLDMQTRIASELQIDATVFQTDINNAINSAISFYDDRDFWFLDFPPTAILLTLTSQYRLQGILPDYSYLKHLVLEMSPSKERMHYLTLSEYLDKDFNDTFTGDPVYWTVDHGTLLIAPKPARTFTAVAWLTARHSLSASSSATNVWLNEAEELIRLHAEVDLLTNRMKDFTNAAVTQQRLDMVDLNLELKSVRRKGKRKTRPHL